MLYTEMVEEFLLDCRIRNLSPKTLSSYKSQLGVVGKYVESEFGITEIEDISKVHYKQFIIHCQENGKAIKYTNTLLKVLRVFGKYVENEYGIQNVARDIRNLKEPKRLLNTFTDDEVRGMISFYNKAGFVNQRNKLIIEIFADAGLRAEELRNVTNANVKEGYFQIIGKGNKERVVKISRYLEKSILKYRRLKTGYFNNLRPQREIEDFLIVTKSGKQLQNNVLLEKIVKDACLAIGVRDEVERKSCHSLRHYYAQKLLKNGINLYTISRLLGHSSIKTTQTYLNSLTDAEILADTEETPLMWLSREGRI